MKNQKITFFLVLLILLSGCATFSPSITGECKGESPTKQDDDKVDVLFIMKHFQQTKGKDAVPKLTRPFYNFDDLLNDALKEISNIGKFVPLTIMPHEVNNVQKRKEISRLRKELDYTVEINITKKKSLVKYFFGIISSTLTATIIPMNYRRELTFEARVYNYKQELIGTYIREGELNKWVEAFLVVAWPFKHDKRMKEALYVNALQNIFLQIENENVLDYSKVKKVTRTIYAHEEICQIIEKQKPDEAISWEYKNINEWVDRKDIAIIVHFPDDGTSNSIANKVFRMDLEVLDKKTNEEGVVFWVNKEEKYPILIISARNETILKSQLENNHYLKVLLNGMFSLPK
jgi:hypothetical protein